MPVLLYASSSSEKQTWILHGSAEMPKTGRGCVGQWPTKYGAISMQML